MFPFKVVCTAGVPRALDGYLEYGTLYFEYWTFSEGICRALGSWTLIVVRMRFDEGQ